MIRAVGSYLTHYHDSGCVVGKPEGILLKPALMGALPDSSLRSG